MLNIKKIRNIMRKDPGVTGDAQRIEQTIWILFLKVYDEYEKKWKNETDYEGEKYDSIIPQELSWDNWAKETKDNKTKTGDELLDFVNNTLFKTFKELKITQNTPLNKSIVKKAFEDTNNFMKDGTLLRQVINEIDLIKFDQKSLSATYESFLKELQSAGTSGEFYTPRALTDFIIEVLNPKIGDKIADLACGTGGFLISAFHFLEKQVKIASDREILNTSFYGIEKKAFPFILCATSFLINGIEEPDLEHTNSLSRIKFDEISEGHRFDIIAMNPPYGGIESGDIKSNFPKEFHTKETADLFMALITERLKYNGRAGVVLPDGFLFGDDSVKLNLKKLLLEEFNLYFILRLPSGVFAPYTSITTNVLFFEKSLGGTKETWFYRFDLPQGYKSFSKTKPMLLEHFDEVKKWLKNKKTIFDENKNLKAQIYKKSFFEENGYDFNQCGFMSEEEEILEPFRLIEEIKKERESLNLTLNSLMDEIKSIIKDES